MHAEAGRAGAAPGSRKSASLRATPSNGGREATANQQATRPLRPGLSPAGGSSSIERGAPEPDGRTGRQAWDVGTLLHRGAAPGEPRRPPGASPVLAPVRGARNPKLADVSGLFTADPAAGRDAGDRGDPADQRSRVTADQAARDAITTGELVVLTTSTEFTGFFASLHAEHPSIGITVLRVPGRRGQPRRDPQFASAEPGQFRELVLAPRERQ